jgi:hypothetical protein
MNARERVLLFALLGVLLLAGGGAVFHLFFWKPLADADARLKAARADKEKKEAELKKERDDAEAAVKADPRVKMWNVLSVPEAPLRPGLSDADRAKEYDKHVKRMQDEYGRYLDALLRKNKFSNLTLMGEPPDTKTSPTLPNKQPLYTRLTFRAQGQATFDGVVGMLRDFDSTPVLHSIRKLAVVRPLTAMRQDNALAAAPGNQPNQPNQGQPADANARQGPGRGPNQPGRGPNGQGGGRADLDVSLTVEVLLVSGSDRLVSTDEAAKMEKAAKAGQTAPRIGLLPDLKRWEVDKKTGKGNWVKVMPPVVLARDVPAPETRDYADILAKNMFTGISSGGNMRRSEDVLDVLGYYKLTMIHKPQREWEVDERTGQGKWVEIREYRRLWEAVLYNQAEPNEEDRDVHLQLSRSGLIVRRMVLRDTTQERNIVFSAVLLDVTEKSVVFIHDSSLTRKLVVQHLEPLAKDIRRTVPGQQGGGPRPGAARSGPQRRPGEQEIGPPVPAELASFIGVEPGDPLPWDWKTRLNAHCPEGKTLYFRMAAGEFVDEALLRPSSSIGFATGGLSGLLHDPD